MNLKYLIAVPVLMLCACSHEPDGVRVVNEPASTEMALRAKTEPVFYNGRTYQVTLSPQSDASATITVSGMSAAQGKDANALATSALFHFACKDSQKAVLHGPAQYSGNMWQAQGRCLS